MSRSIFITLLLVVTSVFAATAQSKSFTGTITYKITYPASASSPLIAALPTSINMQVSGNKAKFEITLPNGKQTIIANGDEISVTRLIENAEGKFFIKKTKEEFKKEATAVATPLKETKTVAGQKCKGAELTVTDKGGRTQKSKVFYSDELGVNNIYFNTVAKSIKGIMLDFDYAALGTAMHLTATQITPGRISNKTFEIPSGYKEITEAQLQQMRQARKNK